MINVVDNKLLLLLFLFVLTLREQNLLFLNTNSSDIGYYCRAHEIFCDVKETVMCVASHDCVVVNCEVILYEGASHPLSCQSFPSISLRSCKFHMNNGRTAY